MVASKDRNKQPRNCMDYCVHLWVSTLRFFLAFPGLALTLIRNPGIPEWYIDFLTLIRERAPGAVAIAACGHIGHAYDLQKPPARSSLSLGAQIEAHAALLQDLHQLFPHARFVSLSHSIGGYISMKASTYLL